MSLTVDPQENRSIRVTDEVVDPRPPDRIEFAVEGVLAMTPALLGAFEGATLKPVRIDVSTDDRDVEIDLSGEASLRLETIDVGLETPDADGLSPGFDSLRSSNGQVDGHSDDGDGEGDDDVRDHTTPTAIAFTVDGAILSVPEDSLEAVADGSPSVSAITFAVEEPVRSDGGSRDEILLAFSLLGYGVAVRRDGTIDVGAQGGVGELTLP